MKKLIEIQSSLKAPKNQYNGFGKYKYRSCEDILEAVKPLLGDAYLTISDTIKEIGARVYVEAKATLTCGEESISVTALAREPESKKGMDESQITGAASSYARKYALNGLFCIDDTRDYDTINKKKVKEKPELVKDSEQWMNAIDFLENQGGTIERIEKKYTLSKSVKELLKEQYES